MLMDLLHGFEVLSNIEETLFNVFNVFVSSGGRLVVMLRVELGTMGCICERGNTTVS